jgi:hypothetical protein
MSAAIGYVRIEGKLHIDRTCAARPSADGIVECEKCALAWSATDKPPPCEPITYTRLVDVVMNEAFRIECTQRALMAAGLRERPNAAELRRAAELRAVAKLIGKYQDEHTRPAHEQEPGS